MPGADTTQSTSGGKGDRKMRVPTVIVAAVLAALLAAGVSLRIGQNKTRFDRVVHESLRTTEGYDQKFIDMVFQLEEELATRAGFGYTGQKDPMTGKIRQVLLPVEPVSVPRARTGERQVVVPKSSADPVKLTAIIFDDEERKFTAIVMDGERSYAVSAGDGLRDRKVTNITTDRIYMESDSFYYYYDIYGKRGLKHK
jgi:hypothetical protein